MRVVSGFTSEYYFRVVPPITLLHDWDPEKKRLREAEMKNTLRMLVAILVGNAIYFSVRTLLPFPFVHERYRVDPGLLLDFVLCLAVYGLLRWRWP